MQSINLLSRIYTIYIYIIFYLALICNSYNKLKIVYKNAILFCKLDNIFIIQVYSSSGIVN